MVIMMIMMMMVVVMMMMAMVIVMFHGVARSVVVAQAWRPASSWFKRGAQRHRGAQPY